MKKITTLLIVLLSLSSTLFGQTKPTYCDSVKSEIYVQISGTKVYLGVKSTGTVASQEWVFNDGTANSKDANPTHDYSKPGSYTPCVYLIIKNPRDANNPCTTKVCKTITIEDPCASFAPSAGIKLGTDGKTITFEAAASNSTSNTYTYSWSFGDNTTSGDRTGTHAYSAGTYKPCVTITSSNPKCTKTLCFDPVTVQDPCAKFYASLSGGIKLGTDGKTATFEASAGTNYTYSWDFGDKTTSTDRVGYHTYSPGTYKPCVTITSTDPKCTKTICFEAITVKENDPCINFNPTFDFTVDANGVATYNGMSGTGLTYSWNFGDGSAVSTTKDGTHQYKPGTYKPCVTITYTSGNTKCTKTLCKEITVKEKDPCADFNPRYEYKIGDNGVVTFWGAGTTTSTYSYVWNYGDGTSGMGIQSNHTYKPGTYKPCVTIYDSKTGCKKTLCWEITISGTNTDPCKDFNPTYYYKIDGNVVVFEAQSGTNYTYKWIFSNSSQTSTDRIVKIDFKKPGTYTACVYITDPKTKCTKKICKEIVIKERETQDPCKDFNPKVSFQTDGLKIKLDVDGGKGATMEWNFGDNTKGSTDRTVTHTYSKAGKYTICVTVYDSKRKCKKTICFTIEVQGKTTDPCADFKPDFSFKVVGNKINVEGTNLSGVEFGWSWGDKLGDKGRVVDHTYKVAGKYYICMTAYDTKTKCTKTICKTIEIGGTTQKMIGNEGDNVKEALSVYPNPADTKVTVVTLSTSDAKISVKDIYGVEVLRYDATPNENKSIDMIVNTLPKGTYYVSIEQDGKVESTKFVK